MLASASPKGYYLQSWGRGEQSNLLHDAYGPSQISVEAHPSASSDIPIQDGSDRPLVRMARRRGK